jgi:hypothetical protein
MLAGEFAVVNFCTWMRLLVMAVVCEAHLQVLKTLRYIKILVL